MASQAILFLCPYAFSTLICGYVAFLAFRRARQPGARAYAILALFETEWILGYIFQTVTPSLGGKLFWNNAQFLGAVGAPFAYYLFCLDYTRTRLRHARLVRGVALAASVIVLGFIWSDGLHHLFRVGSHIVPAQPFLSLVFTNGPAFHAYPVYAYLLLVAGSYTLAVNYFTAPSAYRLQVATVLVGVLFPWVTTLVTWLGIVPLLLHNVTPLAFAVSNLVVGWALFRYQLFDIVPVAHNVLIESMEDGVVVLDRSLRIADMNPAAQRILCLPLTQALGKPLAGRLPVVESVIRGLAEKPTQRDEMELTVDGSLRYYEIRLSQLTDNRGLDSGRLILLHDVTVRRRAEEELHRLAITDPLTGLFNRRHFFKLAELEFERACRSRNPLALILFDVDHFKAVNDTYGHQAGDEVLKALGDRCRETLRSYDILARYGGEEFIIALPESGLDQAAKVGERLRACIADRPFEYNQKKIGVTISLGVACFRNGEWLTLDQLIDQADQALYGAKTSTRNCVAIWQDGKVVPVKA